MQLERLGELNARVGGGEDGKGHGKGPVLVLMHGFGAGGDDLVGLARVLDAPKGTRYVFPEAPLQLDPFGARAWWMIDQELFERRARGEVVDRTDEYPPTLVEVRKKLEGLLEATCKRLGCKLGDIVLGGFSQGSMLALDVALQAEHKPRALLLWSTTLIAKSLWQPKFASLAGLPVFQSHGRNDPLLPFAVAERLSKSLHEAGAKTTFVPFEGGHEIPPRVLSALTPWLSEVTR